MARQLKPRDVKQLAEVLGKQAVVFPGGVPAYYQDLVQRANIPESWKREIAGVWTGSADFDARRLVRFAEAKGINPRDRDWTTLGSLLRTVLEDGDAGLDVNSILISFIDVYELTPAPGTREQFRRRYGIPALPVAEREGADEGPEFDWRGPTDRLQLESWIRAEPPLLDVGFLSGAIRRAASVCRIEMAPTSARQDRRGTGVLIAPGVVLTNHHVMQWHPDEDMQDNARATMLRFLCVASGGEETAGLTFELAADQPIAHVDRDLDFVVLRTERRLASSEIVAVSPLTRAEPRAGSGLNVLQHPRGESMKLAISASGVTGVYANEGVVQYVTSSAPGSSGSPCFDDEWNLVALHHAQRSRAFGRVGEGILARRILDEIADLI
jgi:endonuclease G, mitochondrial